MFGADQPVDPRGWKRAAERGRDRDGMNDIAKGAEADDEDAVQRRILASNSRVAWCFASPTIAVRPPYAVTTARSGTESTV